MNKYQVLAICLIVGVGIGLSTLILRGDGAIHREAPGHDAVHDVQHGDDHGDDPGEQHSDDTVHGAAEVERGPHGGRLLRHPDGFALELTIYEPNIPPQSRVYAYRNNTALDPASVQLSVELHRFNRVDVLTYRPQDGHLQGDKIVDEPHSFDVKVQANAGGKIYTWAYAAYEGRIELPAASAASAGVIVAQAGPKKMTVRMPIVGQIRLNEDTAVHVSPRYAGIIRQLHKQVGDNVRAGEVVAVIEGNDSLQPFEVLAPSAGRVIEKRVTSGETVASGTTLYAIADLSKVWVDLTIYRQDAARVRVGQKVQLQSGDGGAEFNARLSYIAPIGDRASQGIVARAVVNNPDGKLRPGLFVTGEIVVDEHDAKVAVKDSALQTFRDWQVVFKQKGTTYEIAIVELGVKDGEWVEVLSGVDVGESYVSENSFVVKAEIGKAGASHDH